MNSLHYIAFVMGCIAGVQRVISEEHFRIYRFGERSENRAGKNSEINYRNKLASAGNPKEAITKTYENPPSPGMSSHKPPMFFSSRVCSLS